MAKPKLPVERDKWLWVLTKTTGISHEPNGEGPHHVTVQLPNGKFETMPYNPAKMRVAEARGHHLDP